MDPSGVDCQAVCRRFRVMCEEIEALDLQGQCIESSLIDLLEFIKEHVECRDGFVSVFAAMVASGEDALIVPWEVLAFCMHELRWSEVLKIVESALDDAMRRNDWRAINVLANYRDAFYDDWDAADLFKYYSRPDG